MQKQKVFYFKPGFNHLQNVHLDSCRSHSIKMIDICVDHPNKNGIQGDHRNTRERISEPKPVMLIATTPTCRKRSRRLRCAASWNVISSF